MLHLFSTVLASRVFVESLASRRAIEGHRYHGTPGCKRRTWIVFFLPVNTIDRVGSTHQIQIESGSPQVMLEIITQFRRKVSFECHANLMCWSRQKEWLCFVLYSCYIHNGGRSDDGSGRLSCGPFHIVVAMYVSAQRTIDGRAGAVTGGTRYRLCVEVAF